MITVLKKSPRPLYEQIKEGLREQIQQGLYKAGAAIPDERALAAELGISRMTVRRAIVELSREGLLERVSGRGTFVRDSIAPRRHTKTGAVAVVSAQDPLRPAPQYYYRMLQGIACGSEEISLPLAFRQVAEPLDGFIADLRQDRNLKGIIAIWLDEATLRLLSKLSIPVVALESIQSRELPLFDEVTHDGRDGVFSAVSHLIALGHRRIALMRSDGENSITGRRRIGYEQAFTAAGIEVRPELIHRVSFCSDLAYAAAKNILSGPDCPTAFVCTGDCLAIGVMTAALERGMRLPGDLSVVGFGDESVFTSPQLSTVRVPLEQLGLSAIRMLAQRMKDSARPLQHLVMPTEWILRASCDCPRKV
jgi:DNA-binding LacI/PurR family transcriptional regulator